MPIYGIIEKRKIVSRISDKGVLRGNIYPLFKEQIFYK